MPDAVEDLEPGRSTSINTTVLPEEKARIKKLARAESMTSSSYIRRLILQDFAARDQAS
jgi:predicted DNA-binding protein